MCSGGSHFGVAMECSAMYRCIADLSLFCKKFWTVIRYAFLWSLHHIKERHHFGLCQISTSVSCKKFKSQLRWGLHHYTMKTGQPKCNKEIKGLDGVCDI